MEPRCSLVPCVPRRLPLSHPFRSHPDGSTPRYSFHPPLPPAPPPFRSLHPASLCPPLLLLLHLLLILILLILTVGPPSFPLATIFAIILVAITIISLVGRRCCRRRCPVADVFSSVTFSSSPLPSVNGRELRPASRSRVQARVPNLLPASACFSEPSKGQVVVKAVTRQQLSRANKPPCFPPLGSGMLLLAERAMVHSD